MIEREQALAELAKLEWEEGKDYIVVQGPYRHSIEIVCSKHGHQEAIFADGEKHKYFAHLMITKEGIGASMVPVLPDGRLLLVLQQRPAQQKLAEKPRSQNQFWINGGLRNLEDYGPYTSLEFPGGGIKPGEAVSIGLLREMFEETGTVGQEVLLYRTAIPHFIYGSDATSRNFHGTVFLEDDGFPDWVENDDGLHVLALTPLEVIENIQKGTIVSTQAGLMPYFFYEKVMVIRNDIPKGWENLIIKERIKIR